MSEVAVTKTKKRFIAGAVCPACSETDKLMMWNEDGVPHRECVACGFTDKLMMWNEDGVPHRECVACGFTDTLNEQGLSVPKELGTRVNQLAPKAAPAKVQTVQFFPNPKLKKPAE